MPRQSKTAALQARADAEAARMQAKANSPTFGRKYFDTPPASTPMGPRMADRGTVVSPGRPLPTLTLGGQRTSYKKGGSVSSASKRADGCCTKGKTKGKMV